MERYVRDEADRGIMWGLRPCNLSMLTRLLKVHGTMSLVRLRDTYTNLVW